MANTLTFKDNELNVQYEPFIEIPLERYKELIRKEIGYEYRRTELLHTTYITPSTADKLMFQLEEKVEDDDF